jgi:hypothetical protein
MALAAASPCFAKVETVKLKDLTRRSEYVVLGKVLRVEVVDDVKLAEIEVSRILKGSPGVTRLYYWASPSWRCDISEAEVGEEGLYFLWNFEKEFSKPSEDHLQFLEKARPFTQGARVYMLEHSGRGRFRPKYIEGWGYLYVHKDGEVIFPSSIRIVKRPNPEDPGLGLVLLEDVLSYIEKQGIDRAQHNNSFNRSANSIDIIDNFGYYLMLINARINRALCAGG